MSIKFKTRLQASLDTVITWKPSTNLSSLFIHSRPDLHLCDPHSQHPTFTTNCIAWTSAPIKLRDI